jgi:GNAT superfamily N-acetyltransferase
MTQAEQRRAIRPLLNERNPADALAAYYVFHHPEDRTQLFITPVDAGPGQATGFVALSRTGIDLFRPLVTLRLPGDGRDYQASVELLQRALQPGMPVILSAPIAYLPLLHLLLEVQSEETLRLYALDPGRYEPVINVLVARTVAPNNLPRYIIRSTQSESGEIVASAALNWQSPTFAEIAVFTRPDQRRQGWGRSVVAAMVQELLDSGRVPLYVVAEENQPSIQLAESVGFVDTGVRETILQAARKVETS